MAKGKQQTRIDGSAALMEFLQKNQPNAIGKKTKEKFPPQELLASGSTGYLFRTYKAVSNGDAIFKEVTLAFSKFLIVTLCAIAVCLGLCFAAAEILGKGKGRQELSTGNIPLAVLCAAVCIGLSIVLLGMTKPVYEWMTPVYLNFR